MAQGAPLFIGERIQVERAKDQVTIRISQKIKGWQEAMLYAWLMAWTFCGAVFIYSLVTTTVSSEIFFFSICTAVWLYFFYRILRVLMWRKRGEEVLTFTPGKLELRNAFGSKGSSLEVELDKIYEEEFAKKSLFGLFSNLLATMLFYFIVTLLLSFYQKNYRLSY